MTTRTGSLLTGCRGREKDLCPWSSELLTLQACPIYPLLAWFLQSAGGCLGFLQNSLSPDLQVTVREPFFYLE